MPYRTPAGDIVDAAHWELLALHVVGATAAIVRGDSVTAVVAIEPG